MQSIRPTTAEGSAASRPIGEAAEAENDDVSSDEDEVLEESPCGRWQKRKDEVTQKDVPGIDATYLAMDTEEGVEVVWNEMQFSERKKFRLQKSRLEKTFNNLTKLRHNNIVKFYKYWIDDKSEGPTRVIFITEYMTSGSIGQFLRRSKKNKKGVNLKMWKRWCRQILYALSYLHACDPPITHGGLNCDTIFIQHNGLIKIGSVAPDAINDHVKTYSAPRRNLHYISPEYGQGVYTGVDIYAFGVCALEMASMELQGNGGSEDGETHAPPVGSHDATINAVKKLDEENQRAFLQLCLTTRDQRLSARDLLLHPLIFEVHPLRLFAAHSLIQLDETLVNHLLAEKTAALAASHASHPDQILAERRHADGRTSGGITISTCPPMDVEKIVEETRDGLFPLTSIHLPKPPLTLEQAPAAEVNETEKPDDNIVPETRRVHYLIKCALEPKDEDPELLEMILTMRLDDGLRREVRTPVSIDENPMELAQDLVKEGLIHEKEASRIGANFMVYFREAKAERAQATGKSPSAQKREQEERPPQAAADASATVATAPDPQQRQGQQRQGQGQQQQGQGQQQQGQGQQQQGQGRQQQQQQ
eukprot:scpid64962/ scgid5300/ Nuclear receptor-binding protein